MKLNVINKFILPDISSIITISCCQLNIRSIYYDTGGHTKRETSVKTKFNFSKNNHFIENQLNENQELIGKVYASYSYLFLSFWLSFFYFSFFLTILLLFLFLSHYLSLISLSFSRYFFYFSFFLSIFLLFLFLSHYLSFISLSFSLSFFYFSFFQFLNNQTNRSL